MVDGEARFQMVRNMLKASMERFKTIDQAGIVLDQDSDGSHLAPWLTAINEFAKDRGWQV